MKVLELTKRVVGLSGFVRLVDISPRVIPVEHFESNLLCDYAITEAARVSYSNAKKIKSDINLIHYLYSHGHTSPFEMVTFKFHVKAPIFVTRQWQRHRMSSFNEISGRYSKMDNSFWFPDHFRKQSVVNKQGSGGEIDPLVDKVLMEEYSKHLKNSHELYTIMLNSGVSKELARTVLPLSLHTEFYWKIDLHNLLRFISLRSDKHAQQEIREYSDAMKSIISEYCPNTLEAFDNYVTNSIRLSDEEIKIMKSDQFDHNPFGGSKSSLDLFHEKIKRLGS